MEIVLNSKFFTELSVEQLGEKTIELGYDGVDICVRPGHPIHVDNVVEALPKAMKVWAGQNLTCPLATAATDITDPNAPEEALRGGHGTSEYYMVRDFIGAIEQNTRPPIDVARALDFTIPGIIAHESAMQGGKWLDVPLF